MSKIITFQTSDQFQILFDGKIATIKKNLIEVPADWRLTVWKGGTQLINEIVWSENPTSVNKMVTNFSDRSRLFVNVMQTDKNSVPSVQISIDFLPASTEVQVIRN
jgi:hypothetical protein